MPLIVLWLSACGVSAATPVAHVAVEEGTHEARPLAAGEAEARFAAGCFWCVEAAFDDLPGVVEAVSGYTGGTLAKPTYEVVGHGEHEHREAVRVVYKPAEISYEKLLDVFWHNVDPFDGNGQFCDQGTSYRSAIWPVDDAQRAAATASKAAVQERLGAPVVVPILTPTPFWEAEAYHQDYHHENPVRYAYYRRSCGRDARLAEVWGAAR